MTAALLRDPIGTLMPGCNGEERRQRERLFKSREYASAAVIRRAASPEARTLYWMICDLATACLYASASFDDLKDAADQCVRLAICASYFCREAGNA